MTPIPIRFLLRRGLIKQELLEVMPAGCTDGRDEGAVVPARAAQDDVEQGGAAARTLSVAFALLSTEIQLLILEMVCSPIFRMVGYARGKAPYSSGEKNGFLTQQFLACGR